MQPQPRITLFHALIALIAVAGLGYALLEFSAWLGVWRFKELYSEALHRVGQDPVLIMLAQLFGMIAVPIFVVGWSEPNVPWQDALAIKSISARVAAVAFLWGLTLQIPLAQISQWTAWLTHTKQPELRWVDALLHSSRWVDWAKAMMCLVFVPPFTEELFFRGWMLPRLQSSYGWRWGLVWSAFLFGFAHGSLPAMAYASSAGVVLGIVALRAQSIWASVAVHMGINGAAMIAHSKWFTTRGTVQDVVSMHAMVPSAWLVSSSALAVALGLVYLRYTRSTS